jgi:hypothetical protein
MLQCTIILPLLIFCSLSEQIPKDARNALIAGATPPSSPFYLVLTLACCLRHYDDLHQTSPLSLHPDIAALSPFATILHDLYDINGDMHSLSHIILSYL